MGPLRRGLIAALVALPAPALAQAMVQTCAEMRPGWDGTPPSPLDEAVALASSPAVLILLLLSALALRLRAPWFALAVVLGWTVAVSMVTMLDPGGARAAGMAEGCVGRPVLFVAMAFVVSAGLILRSAPRRPRE